MRIIVMKTMSSRAQPRSVDDNSDVDRCDRETELCL